MEVFQSSFRSEQVGNRTPAAIGIGTKAATFHFPVRFHGFELRGIIPIFAEPN